jgi:hypothetical protein
MLTWTDGGAVARPRTLQVRLQRSYPGRVRAGAPVPTRHMPTAEVEANLRHFTSAGPRGLPVDALVLSGVGAAARSDLASIVATARSLGVRRVTLHAGVEDLAELAPAALPVDAIVLPLQPGEAGAMLAAGARALDAARACDVPVAANTVLSPSALPMLPAIARVAIRGGARSLAFTFPFPVDGSASADVPPAARAVAALREVIPSVEAAGVRVSVKGLPACYLGPLARLADRTANRWYVDADHQLDRALLFFPDVVAFHKDEACRFCAHDARCDGFFATYLRRPGFAPLRAVAPEEADRRS